MKKQRRTNLKNRCHSWHRLLFLAVMMLISVTAMAQRKVTGKVVDANGEPIIGASVMVKGTSTGAITDLDGNFTITNAPQNGTLVVSYVSYRTQNIGLEGKSNFNITLEEDRQLLDEVVVVGYGVQRKSDVTGALTRVGEKELNAKPVNNAFEALQGKAAGVDITTSQRPGTVGGIMIRGQRSMGGNSGASTAPLYVVDGVPLQAGGIETLNPKDIEAIDILKDASSTAIYGSRGANGVVLITTKHGQEGKAQLSYSGSFTFEKIVDKSPAMNASDYITWRRWAYYNSAPDKYTPGNQPTQEQDKAFFAGDDTALANVMRGWSGGSWDGSKVTDTDWTDFVTQTGVTQEHNVSVRGGSKKVNGFALSATLIIKVRRKVRATSVSTSQLLLT
jgi:TonB-linked SusC/RagA family outer membrane protein